MVFTMSTNYNINLTDNALKKILSLVEQENQGSVLRIAVSGGGCSGFKYDFLIDHLPSLSDYDEDDEDEGEDEDDGDYGEDEDEEEYEEDEFHLSKRSKDVIISDNSGNPVLMIDNCSVKFLQDSVIDYIEDLSGSKFQIRNEMVKSQCGCGNSFSV